MRNLSLIVLIWAGFALFSCRVVVADRPTAPVYVRPAPPRAGYVWIDGDWRPRRRAYVWREGYWAQPRPNRQWRAGTWQTHPRGYSWNRGRWTKGRH